MSRFLFDSPSSPQQTPAMPHAHPHTVNTVVARPIQSDEDKDICPVCDGECTCTNLLPSATPKLPSLKIKLTIPPSMITKPRTDKLVEPMTSVYAAGGGRIPKRRGRPPKTLTAGRVKTGTAFYSRPISKKSSIKLKGKNTIVKTTSVPLRKRAIDYSSSELDDIDDPYHNGPASLPTFVPASVLSSTDSDAASSSGFDSDSSNDGEKQSYRHQTEKSRMRRELLRDEGQSRRNLHEDWALRSRKRSDGSNDGLSDAKMDIDSDETELDEADEEDGDDDEAEPDGLRVGSGYIGLATGWSEDEESSFDADLFFANLSDSDDNDSPGPPDEHDERAEEGDQSDLDGSDAFPQLELHHDWDGQIIFSTDGPGLLDVDFEVAASLVATAPSPSDITDNERQMVEEDGEFEGDTTDEELVGEDHLPNERAMRMFVLPFSVSSINPLSTMSPSSSPAVRHRQPFGSPRPADILSGRVFVEDSDEENDYDYLSTRSVSSKGNGPRTGAFVPNDTVTAIIDDTHSDVLSPHPHTRRRRPKLASSSSKSIPSRPPSLQILSSSELTTSPELLAQTMDLDDVLDLAYLDSEPSEEPLTSPTEQSRRHLNLSRWGWGSDTPAADYGNVLKSSPMSTLWQDNASKSNRPRDGDRTPTNSNPPPPKTRKPPRKPKQKNQLGYDRAPQQQHYFRHHHPNQKTRGSLQRNNFNGSPPAIA